MAASRHSGTTPEPDMASRPNFLFIMCDQFRADCIGALGNPHIRTPNLDRLARQGTVFERAYTPSPVCVPARAALHYSLYPARTGCLANHTDFPSEQTPGYIGMLTDAGYRTHAIGKCHFLPDPLARRGFLSRETQEEVVRDRHADDYLQYLDERGYGHVIDPHGVRGMTYYLPQPTQLPARDHSTQWVGDRAINFLHDRSRTSQPFALLASFIHPHPPFMLPAPWYRLYEPDALPAPLSIDNADDVLTVINKLQMKRKFRDYGTDGRLMQLIRAYYYAAISFVDFQIGRILSTLQDSGKAADTVVLFFSDHGEYLGDFGCFGKRGMHEVVARVPLIVADPQARAGVVKHPVSLVDIGPSVLARAGIAAPRQWDGQAIFGTAEAAHRPVFSQFGPPEAGLYMVADDWGKYVYSSYEQRQFLFAAADGFFESRNRIGEAGQAKRAERYRDLLRGYDPRLEIAAKPPAQAPSEAGFAALNNDLGPLTSLHPWVRLDLPDGY